MKKKIVLLISMIAVAALLVIPAVAMPSVPGGYYDDDYYDDYDPVGSNTAWITVSSVPDGARVYDETMGQSGTTPFAFEVHEGTRYWGVPHVITVSKSGYEDYSTVTRAITGGEVHVTANLKAIEVYGYISVSSSPSGATVYIDGIAYGVTPVSIPEDPGYHSISVTKRGYESYYGQVYVSAGSTSQVYATLKSEVSNGYISVSSSPSYADVYIDGAYKGTTPVTSSVSPGSHTVKVSKSGYDTISRTVSVNSGSTTSVSVSLAQPANSYINIMSTPHGADVYVDGAYKGKTSPNNQFLSVGPLSPGSHTVTLELSGYNKYTSSVYLGNNEVKSLSVTMTQPMPSTSALHITTDPSGANVFIDNTYRGYAPLTLNDIAPGYHKVTVSRDGYNSWEESINFEQGKTVERSVALSAVTPTASPMPAAVILLGLAAAALFALGRRE